MPICLAGYKIYECLIEGVVNFWSVVGKIIPSFTGMPCLLARVLLVSWPLSCDSGHAMNWHLDGEYLWVCFVKMPCYYFF